MRTVMRWTLVGMLLALALPVYAKKAPESEAMPIQAGIMQPYATPPALSEPDGKAILGAVVYFDRAHGTFWGGSSNYGEDYGIGW